jgi:hypothetical protein
MKVRRALSICDTESAGASASPACWAANREDNAGGAPAKLSFETVFVAFNPGCDHIQVRRERDTVGVSARF